MATVEFMGLSYYTSIVTDENMTIGVMFHDLDTDKRIFNSISNFRRFHSFDDEVDLGMLKDLLDGIRIEIENDFHNPDDAFELGKYRESFVNNYRFSEVTRTTTDDFDQFVDEMTRIFLRLDYKQEERIPKKDVVRVYKRLMREHELEFSTKPVTGVFDETVRFDYVRDNTGYKYIALDGKNPQRLVQSLKSWAFTAESLRGRMKTVFIVDEIPAAGSKYEKLVIILSQGAKVIGSGDYMHSLMSLDTRSALSA